MRSGETDSELAIAVFSSDTTEVQVPATVIIPAGASEVSFPITPQDDLLSDGTMQVAVTATASGFVSGQDLLDVWDDELAEQDLVAYWSLDDGIGTNVADASPFGNDNSGTVEGGAVWSDFGLNHSLILDGDDDYVDVPDSSDLNLLTVTERTVSLWMNVDDKGISARKQVVLESGGSKRGLNIYVHDGLLYLGGWNTPTDQSGWSGTFLATPQIESGQWHHVALVLDGGPTLTTDALRGYLDGVPFASGEGSQIWSHSGDIGLGRVDGAADEPTATTKFHSGDITENGHAFAGLMDEVRVYNRALLPHEITVLAGQQLIDPAWLDVSVEASEIPELGGSSLATVTRAGDASDDLEVTLSSSDVSQLDVPSTITIPAGQSSANIHGQCCGRQHLPRNTGTDDQCICGRLFCWQRYGARDG